MADTLIDYSLLHSQLSRSKLQATNNSAYQTINSLIGGVKSFQDFVQTGFSAQDAQQSAFAQSVNAAITDIYKQLQDLNDQISGFVDLGAGNATYIVEVPSGPGILGVDLSVAYTQGWLIIKDITGQAGAYPFTITGIVDGVTNPVMSTPYGVMRVYQSTDGHYYTW